MKTELLTQKDDKFHANGYLTRFDVAKLLNISLVSLNAWSKSRKLLSCKVKSRVLYKVEEINKFLSLESELTTLELGNNH
jgi:hypothetical protein